MLLILSLIGKCQETAKRKGANYFHGEESITINRPLAISCGKIEVYSTSCIGMMPSESSSACLLSGKIFRDLFIGMEYPSAVVSLIRNQDIVTLNI